jgi:hypothetical protein
MTTRNWESTPFRTSGYKNFPNERRCPVRSVIFDPDARSFNIVFSGKATRKEVTQNKNVKVLTIEK